MSDKTKDDSNGADGPHDDGGHGDVLAEKKLLARRRFLTGGAAAGVVLGTVNRAHAIGASVCFSIKGQPVPTNVAGLSFGNLLDPDLPHSIGDRIDFVVDCFNP